MRTAQWAEQAARLLLLSLLGLSHPASAEVVTKSETGFVVRLAIEVMAPPEQAWRTLTMPAQWWSSQHTFSGEAANLTFDPVVGGCFCETLPRPEGAPASQKLGGVQHMRVVYIEPPRAMRLTGALGPLQSEALSATMTMTVKPTDTPAGKGSRILFEYVVGGFMRYKVDEIVPAVDRMLAAQLLSLAGKLGPVSDPAAQPADAAPSSAAQVGPPAPDAELAPVKPITKPVVPLRGAANYRLPPARGTTPASPPRSVPPVEKAPIQVASPPAPETAPLVLPLPAAKAAPKTAAKPAAKLVPKATPKIVPKPAAKPAPKAPHSDDAAHRDANAAFDALLGGVTAP